MFLQEYLSKQYFSRFGIPTPEGKTVLTPYEAAASATEFGAAVVINAQSLSSERVFRLAATPQDAENRARDLLEMSIGGVRVRKLLVEPQVDIEAEYFLGMYGNRGSDLLMFASSEGGSELSMIERNLPATLFRETINPFLGIHHFQARNLASGINLPREAWSSFSKIAKNLYRCAIACDAVRAEINPLGLTRTGELVALGGRLVIDDNALFRQPELASLRDVQAEHETSVRARASGITYIRLNGRIGCVVSGAGLGMATLDLLARQHMSASSLLDLGSEMNRGKISEALRLIEPNSDALLFNLFADRAPCEQIATELVAALNESPPAVPIVVRLAGYEAELGHALLNAAPGANLWTAESTSDAVRLVAGVGV